MRNELTGFRGHILQPKKTFETPASPDCPKCMALTQFLLQFTKYL